MNFIIKILIKKITDAIMERNLRTYNKLIERKVYYNCGEIMDNIGYNVK